MNQLRACLSVSSALLLTALCGLLFSPPARAQEDVLRATPPPPGKALLFIFRSERQPVAGRVPVTVNTRPAGELANGTLVTATVNPGRTFLRTGDQVQTSFTVEAAANQSYFVLVEAVPGLRPVRAEMRLVSEIEARRLLAQSRGVAPAPTAAAPRVTPPPPPIVAAPSAAPPPIAAAPRAAPPPIVAAPPPPPIAAAPPSPAAKPAATQPEAARETSRSTESGSDWDLALIANAGAFKLANGNQMVAGRASTYDTKSKPVFGIEAEWRNKAGFAVGGEVFSYKNDLVANGTGFGAQQQVYAVMGNGKYYYQVADWLYPFVGAGVGFTSATYSGNFTGSGGGAAYQGLVGMEFRFEWVGFHVEYKYLGSTTGASGKQVKVGGRGVLAGVSITF